jgi:hypothetical protein
MSHPTIKLTPRHRLALKLLAMLQPDGINCAPFGMTFDTGESTTDDLQLVMRLRDPTTGRPILSVVIDADHVSQVVTDFLGMRQPPPSPKTNGA